MVKRGKYEPFINSGEEKSHLTSNVVEKVSPGKKQDSQSGGKDGIDLSF